MTHPAASAGAASNHGVEGRIDLAPDRLLHNWEGALRRAESYALALGFDAAEATGMARRAVLDAVTATNDPAGNVYAEVLALVRAEIQRQRPELCDPGADGDGFPEWRLNAALETLPHQCEPNGKKHRVDGATLATPPISRRSMPPNRLRGRSLLRRAASDRRSAESSPAADGVGTPQRRRQWERAATRRRVLLGILVALPSLIAARFMIEVLPHQGANWLEIAISVFFGALFGWISIGFWTALAGFAILASGRDRFAITGKGVADAERSPHGSTASPRTAIVMPICEEPVDRIFAGLAATYQSLERTGHAASFDWFVLSDTADPDRWVDEEAAWFDWRRTTGDDRIFYRRRRIRVARKSGNLADFCRRWGARYRYMIVLDADSVMAGDTMQRLVEMMEASPTTALIQTVPAAFGRQTLFGRVQQFAARAYGPMFAAGLHYWQLGDGQYWGHNAIIRVAPFMEHCSLPTLPGKPPLGGEILSHDFVEAALLGRAGWDLWLAYDLGGTWEESSTSLLEEMKRDRRWCQGNLQHLRLILTRGLAAAHRALFLNGIMSYVSALLWFCFLALSTSQAVWDAIREPDYFPAQHSLFPSWPVWRPDWAIALALVTAAILFVPKLLSILLIASRGEAKAYGGLFRLSASALLEIVFSTLMAPIRMVFHTRFVLTNLLGYTVGWRSSSRQDDETGWGEALRQHGLDTLVASAWGLSVHWLNPDYFWWLTPIVAGLVLSVPVSVLASRVRLGVDTRERGLFLIPEETNPSPELAALENALAARTAAPAHRRGFARVAIDPLTNAVHRVLLRGPRRLAPAIAEERQTLAQRAMASGAAELSAEEKLRLLYDPELVTSLHRGIWTLDADLARHWHDTDGNGVDSRATR